jgi:choline dehydrogenase-like flavoprotein
MAPDLQRLRAQTVIVGSGPGGATVARELTRRGREVLILEEGAYHKPVGSWRTMLKMLDHMGNFASIEGTQMVRLLTVGGSTVSFCGVAFPPPSWLKDRHGIDLTPYVDEVSRELGLAPLPDRLVGGGAQRIMAAAREEGLDWKPFPHFIDPAECDLSCPKCMIGCAKGAKWTARDYVEEAMAAGARLKVEAHVEEVLSDGGKVTGVRGLARSGPFVVEAERVVVAGGGLGTPMLLQASGIEAAGKNGFFIDPLCLTSGISKGPGSSHDIPMSCGTTEFQEEGIIMTDVVDPWPLYFFGLIMGGPRRPRNFLGYPKTLGIMTKSRDPLTGYIRSDGKVSKPLGKTELDLLDRGREIAGRILVRAGCDPDTILNAPPRGAHPGGTVRIDDVLDRDLQTQISGLYVCDSSVIPEPMGLPPVLTIIGLAKRLVSERLEKQPAATVEKGA